MEQKEPGISERETAILGLLCENPLYGYTIEKIIEERGMRHWTEIGFSSIYYVLKRLEAKRLITSSCERQEDRPSRKVYTITGGGRSLMKSTVCSLLTRHTRVTSPFDLGIAHLPLISGEEAVACLNGRLAALDRTIAHITRIRREKETEVRPYHVLALFDRALAHLYAEKTWVETFIGEVKRHAGKTTC